MRNNKSFYLFVLCALLVNRPVFGRTVKSLNTSIKSNKRLKRSRTYKRKKKESYNLSFSSLFETGLYSENKSIQKDTQREQHAHTQNTTSVTGAYIYSKSLLFNSAFIFDKNLTDTTEEIKIRDIELEVKKRIRVFNRTTNIETSFMTYLPVSEESRNITELRTGLKLHLDLNTKITRVFKVSYRPSLRFNLYKYETDINGISNTQYIMSNGLILSYKLTNFFKLYSRNYYINKVDYLGENTQLYSLSQSLEINFLNNFFIDFGHAIGGTALTENQVETDIQVYDQDKSTIFINLTYSF